MIIERTGTMWPPPPGSKLGSFSLWSRILNFKSIRSFLESQTQTKSLAYFDPKKAYLKAIICLFLTSYINRLSSADTAIFINSNFASVLPMKTWKRHPLKVGHTRKIEKKIRIVLPKNSPALCQKIEVLHSFFSVF